MKKKPKPVGKGNYSVCKTCRGTGYSGNPKHFPSLPTKGKEAIAVYPCKDCIDGTGNSRGWVDAEH
jgi:predicted chitinase